MACRLAGCGTKTDRFTAAGSPNELGCWVRDVTDQLTASSSPGGTSLPRKDLPIPSIRLVGGHTAAIDLGGRDGGGDGVCCRPARTGHDSPNPLFIATLGGRWPVSDSNLDPWAGFANPDRPLGFAVGVGTEFAAGRLVLDTVLPIPPPVASFGGSVCRPLSKSDPWAGSLWHVPWPHDRCPAGRVIYYSVRYILSRNGSYLGNASPHPTAAKGSDVSERWDASWPDEGGLQSREVLAGTEGVCG